MRTRLQIKPKPKPNEAREHTMVLLLHVPVFAKPDQLQAHAEAIAREIRLTANPRVRVYRNGGLDPRMHPGEPDLANWDEVSPLPLESA